MSVTQASYTSSLRGNLRWMAPELLGQSNGDLPVCPSKYSDIYSFGGIMLQVCLTNYQAHKETISSSRRSSPAKVHITI